MKIWSVIFWLIELESNYTHPSFFSFKKIKKAKEDISSELLVAIKSLLLILDIVVAVLLEKKICKNSSNSGLAPSQDIGGVHNDRNNKDRKNGEKKGEQLDNTRTVEYKEILSPEKCSGCDADLKSAKVTDTEERKTIDIVYEIQQTTLISETRQCSDCGEETKAKFPKGVEGPLQYGIGIKAAIINFLMVQNDVSAKGSGTFQRFIGTIYLPGNDVEIYLSIWKIVKRMGRVHDNRTSQGNGSLCG